MTNTFYLNSLELSPINGIYITNTVSFDPSSTFETESFWHGTTVNVTDIQPKTAKVVLKGYCSTELALQSLAYYHITNYNWNEDSENVYLIKDLSRRWKVRSLELSYEHSYPSMPYPFNITIILSEVGAEGYVQSSKEGSSNSSPVSITSILNLGDQINLYESLKIIGSYYDGSNLVSPVIEQDTVGYNIVISDVLLDSAEFEFYNNYTAKHTYIDVFVDSNKFTYNSNSSVNVTFSTNHLSVAANGSLVYRFQLGHPLLEDPVLTMTISSLVGSPKLEVSTDNVNWWECEKSLVAGSLIEYNLTKISGSNDFYFRVTTDSSSSLNIYYMKLVSWHNYSGQRPIPYLRANSVEEKLNLTFSAGAIAYDVRYRDKWSV